MAFVIVAAFPSKVEDAADACLMASFRPRAARQGPCGTCLGDRRKRPSIGARTADRPAGFPGPLEGLHGTRC